MNREILNILAGELDDDDRERFWPVALAESGAVGAERQTQGGTPPGQGR